MITLDTVAEEMGYCLLVLVQNIQQMLSKLAVKMIVKKKNAKVTKKMRLGDSIIMGREQKHYTCSI
ncbi:hypothetical protein OA90_27495 [Labrenzia sp. OB1]|nr:hypothetical protein OA90_27495 [Labrenzia sp. OB1]